MVEQQTWVTLVAIAGFTLTLLGYLRNVRHDLAAGIGRLENQIGAVRTELRADTADLRTEVRTDFTELRTELKTDIAGIRTELKTDIAGIRTELKTDFTELRTELKSDIASSHADLKADIGRVDGRLVALESRAHDIAIRLPATLAPVEPTAP